MPPQPEISPEVIFDGLKDAEIFREKSLLKKQSDPVWSTICDSLNIKMKPKSLYLYVYNDRNNCKTNLLKYKGLKPLKKKKKKSAETEEFVVHKDCNPKNCKPLNFQIKLNEEEWSKVKHSEVNKNRLKKGWTNIVYKKIWEEEKLPCAYNFKNCYVDIDQSVIFSGYCTDCKTSIYGKNHDQKDMSTTLYTFEIKTYATHKVLHTKKRKLAFDDRVEAKKILLNKHATGYKEDLRNELMLNSSYEPANLHDSRVYEKARQEARNDDIQYTPSLTVMCKFVREKCGVRKVSWNPFYVFYWTDKQVEFWNRISHLNLPLSLDSTGSVVKRVKYKSIVKSKTIFYYVIVVGFEGKIIPLWQMISSIHHVAVIEEGLKRWIEESNATIPKEMCTDGSPTLQNAITLATSKLTFVEYNLQCYKILIKELSDLPKCFYRSDIFHLLQTLNQWKCFNGFDNDIIQFYKRCIGFMSQLDSIVEFRKVALAVFVVSMSPVTMDDSPCYKSLRFLTQTLRTYNLPETETHEKLINSPSITYYNNEEPIGECKNALSSYINDIVVEAKSLCLSREKVTDKPNFYHCEKFYLMFQSLCEKFPSWTNTMIPFFKSPNKSGVSARSETYFKIKKEQVQKPLTVIKFILKDGKKINSLIKYGFSKYRTHDHLSATKLIKKSEDDLFDLSDKLQIDDLANCEVYDNHRSFNKSFLIESKNEIKIKKEKYLTDINTHEKMDVQKTIVEQNLNEFNQNKENENLVTFEKSIITRQDVINTLNQSKEYENVVAIEMSEQNEGQNSILDKSSQCEEHDNLVRSDVPDEIDSIVDKSSHFEDLDLLNLPIKTNHNQSSLLEIIVDDLVNSTPNPFEERSVVLNGILIPTKIYIINEEEKELKFINTCAFDSLFEISVNMYWESSSIRTMFTRLDTTSSINFASAILNYIKNFDLDHLYQDRATILLPLFKEVIAVVNCRVNVNNLFKALFESYNTCTIRHFNCCCGHSEQKSLFSHSISTRDFFFKGIHLLEQIINDDLLDTLIYCSQCNKKSAHSTYELREMLIIDLEYFYEKQNTSMISTLIQKNVTNTTTYLNDIPKGMIIKKQMYHLRGIVEFVEPLNGTLLHYVAYCYSNDKFFKYNDMINNIEIVQSNPQIKIALIVYSLD